MRALLIVAAALLPVLTGCKDKKRHDKASHDKVSSPKVDWAACELALAKAASVPIDSRVQILLAGCHACGADWQPLLAWNREPGKGGPTREQIEQLMVSCDAFCTGDSKLKFMASVDKVRGQSVNTPWRQLENSCKAKVNGAADDRFMSAPFFALDRIARGAAAQGGTLAAKLAVIELPLPAVTISGAGPALPIAEPVGPMGSLQLTVLGGSIHVGRLPRGKLTAAGVTVDLGNPPYPGELVKLDQLAAKLTALVGNDKTQPITILAPHEMLAQPLVDIVAVAARIAPVQLGANAPESPLGWPLPAPIPIVLEAGTELAVTAEMTVQDLAAELAARVERGESRVGVSKQ